MFNRVQWYARQDYALGLYRWMKRHGRRDGYRTIGLSMVNGRGDRPLSCERVRQLVCRALRREREAEEIDMWVYLFNADRDRYEVGFYRPDGNFEAMEWFLHDEAEESAQALVNYLNGGSR